PVRRGQEPDGGRDGEAVAVAADARQGPAVHVPGPCDSLRRFARRYPRPGAVAKAPLRSQIREPVPPVLRHAGDGERGGGPAAADRGDAGRRHRGRGSPGATAPRGRGEDGLAAVRGGHPDGGGTEGGEGERAG